ncbi:hypothetical protein MsAg5_12050 [Methanosarcinaceae archaeon Ag5]|uniref:SIR2-like domain-containing protein n=1 Tax=Methanolapillus africanus TaxID=3028297 RepID=A0AAE4MK32_9EURY|nr:hypothetical protein [Methanosarcinaceae archaeon Ag5]
MQKIIKGFNTIPFLFIGSGLTRRYCNLPDWKTLLEIFANRINDDEFAYVSYENKAKINNPNSGFPEIVDLIEKDFNEKWYSTSSFRQLDDEYLEYVRDGASPFKAEVAAYVKKNSIIRPECENEIRKLSQISKKSISGLITTNFDCFLENITDGYKTYIGQEELIFSPIQGIAEIYKIHGCVNNPKSIIMNQSDYNDFERKSLYLAAKLMTIFMEYPIIFIGYSMSDPNIQRILESIINCLSAENLKKLKNRFIFIDYDESFQDVEISPYTFHFDVKAIEMTKIKMSRFELLYDALSTKKSALPAKVLRLFKQEFYDYTLTNMPTSNLRVGSIDDTRIEDEHLIVAIGKASEIGLIGLKGISGDDWYEDIVMENLNFTADDLLEYAYPNLIKNASILPLNKYLSICEGTYPSYTDAKMNDFESIINSSYKKRRHTIAISDRSVLGIWKQNDSLEKKTRLIAHLYEEEIDVDDLERILKEIFQMNPDFFINVKAPEKTNVRRLIRIYDYLKFGKKEL